MRIPLPPGLVHTERVAASAHERTGGNPASDPAPHLSTSTLAPVVLRDGDSEAQILPHGGGRLMHWRTAGVDVLYWPSDVDDATLSDPMRVAKLRGGNPLLFPFIGRHRVGDTPNQWRNADGKVYDLPQHGFARHTPFSTRIDADGKGVVLTLTPAALSIEDRAGYPFDFRFEAHYRLQGTTLEVTLTTYNTGSTPLPYYAGHHFYFALPHALREQSTVTLPSAVSARQAADGSIVGVDGGASPFDANGGRPFAKAGAGDHTTFRPGDPAIQDAFHLLLPRQAREAAPVAAVSASATSTTARQQAVLQLPPFEAGGAGRRISIDLDLPDSVEWYAVTTWTESDSADFYCVEPWLGLPNAIAHGHGLRWLPPGQHELARCRIVLQTV